MKMFSECASKCDTCHSALISTCLAGHGDDDYYKLTEKDLLDAMTRHPVILRDKWKYGLYTKVIAMFPHLETEIRRVAGYLGEGNE